MWVVSHTRDNIWVVPTDYHFLPLFHIVIRLCGKIDKKG